MRACFGRCVYVPKTFSAFRRHAGQKSVSAAASYEIERQMARKRMLQQLNVPRSRKAVAETYYWLAVRWRHFVVRRLHRSAIRGGVSVFDLQEAQ